ncbi:MAG: N-acyl-L-amino acid amidohydrolase [Verrucomicrobia bacterium]|nr:N-acyl-L-amino acid amidohydrolase [Verrucomicrobiota bacterium]|tara:strand:+ start:171 stop:1376 length:1206 start_codon:yes stop_codon:yes gene_type:complete
MKDTIQKVKQLSDALFDEIQSIRHHLHEHPELSFQEYETADYLISMLKKWGIEIDQRWVKTGFTVILEGKYEGATIGLRADLDALPIQEQNQVPYASRTENKMHACGHDVHAACLMGAIKILHELKDSWAGKLVFIFQAGEEKLPGGASLMIEEGLLDKYQPERVIAQHVYPEYEVGLVGFKSGMYMASADEIYLTVKGKGGHAALPHRNIDPIVIAANIVVELQQLSSRIAPPTIPTVLSFGKIQGEGATNVIPDTVTLEGTLRTMDEECRSLYHQKIQQIAQKIAEAHGGECDVNIIKGYPFLVNDTIATACSKAAAEIYLGSQNVKELDLRMTAEDFAYFSQRSKVCFYRLGVGNKEKEIVHSVHHPKFNIDESALKHGMGLMAFIALCNLEEINQSQ